MKKNQRMWTRNRSDLQTLRSQPPMPKNLPDHWGRFKFFPNEDQTCSTLKQGHTGPTAKFSPHGWCGWPNSARGLVWPWFHLYMCWNVVSMGDASRPSQCDHDTWQIRTKRNCFSPDREPSTGTEPITDVPNPSSMYRTHHGRAKCILDVPNPSSMTFVGGHWFVGREYALRWRCRCDRNSGLLVTWLVGLLGWRRASPTQVDWPSEHSLGVSIHLVEL